MPLRKYCDYAQGRKNTTRVYRPGKIGGCVVCVRSRWPEPGVVDTTLLLLAPVIAIRSILAKETLNYWFAYWIDTVNT